MAYEEARRAYEFEAMATKAREEGLKKKLKDAYQKGLDMESLKYEYLTEIVAEEPVRRRHLVNDATVEAIGVLLNQNPRGLLLNRDELYGWLKTLDKQGHENDRAFYLEAWNGTGSYTYDRIGRGTLPIKSACVSVLGGIQPNRLIGYLDDAVKGGQGDDGLIQRFQLMVYPDPPSEWSNIDREPDGAALKRAHAIFQALAALDPATFAERSGEDGPYFVRFDEEAQDFFDAWRFELENRLRTLEHGAMEAHLAKYRSLMPSLALVFHLIDVADGSITTGRVSLLAAEMAAAWCEFLEAHAYRIYGLVSEGGLARARELARHIEQGDLSTPFKARDVYRKGWHLLCDPSEVEEALGELDELGWVRAERRPPGTPGPRVTEYTINPKAVKEARK